MVIKLEAIHMARNRGHTWFKSEYFTNKPHNHVYLKQEQLDASYTKCSFDLELIFVWPWKWKYLIFIYMTVLSLGLVSTKWDESNESKITQIGQLEAEIFTIVILGFKSRDLYRKNRFFHFSSFLATDSLRYVKFINLR